MNKFKPGDMARLDNRRATWVQIIALPEQGHIRYTTLSQDGYIGYYSDGALKTTAEWLQWWEGFRDELPPKEWRECAENARKEFVPPAEWDMWVQRATVPPENSTALKHLLSKGDAGLPNSVYTKPN